MSYREDEFLWDEDTLPVAVEKAYNPDQLRDPKGTPTGGQFAASGAFTYGHDSEERNRVTKVLSDATVRTVVGMGGTLSGRFVEVKNALRKYLGNYFGHMNGVLRYGEAQNTTITTARDALLSASPIDEDVVLYRGNRNARKKVGIKEFDDEMRGTPEYEAYKDDEEANSGGSFRLREALRQKYDEKIIKAWEAKVGEVLPEKGFYSLSENSDFAAGWAGISMGNKKTGGTDFKVKPDRDQVSVIYSVKLPKGTRGMHLPTSVGGDEDEGEFLLPPGARMKVTRVRVVKTETENRYSSPILMVDMELVGQDGVVEKAYNPDQPRQPKGVPTGGQFASTDGGEVTGPFHYGADQSSESAGRSVVLRATEMSPVASADQADALQEYQGSSYTSINTKLRTGELHGSTADNYIDGYVDLIDDYIKNTVVPTAQDVVLYRGNTTASKKAGARSFEEVQREAMAEAAKTGTPLSKMTLAELAAHIRQTHESEVLSAWKAKEGEIISEDGFYSLSGKSGFAMSWSGVNLSPGHESVNRRDTPPVLYTVRVPKGSRGVYLPYRIGASRAEDEFLMSRKTKTRVVKVTGHRMKAHDPFNDNYDTVGTQLVMHVELEVIPNGAVGKAYDPDQPRDPAGTPTGGQWTSDGSFTFGLRDDEEARAVNSVTISTLSTRSRLEGDGSEWAQAHMGAIDESLMEYSGIGYSGMNTDLRRGNTVNSRTALAAKTLAEADPLEADVVLYRGNKSAYKKAGVPAFGEEKTPEHMAYLEAGMRGDRKEAVRLYEIVRRQYDDRVVKAWEDRVGKTVEEKGFYSLSADPSFAMEWAGIYPNTYYDAPSRSIRRKVKETTILDQPAVIYRVKVPKGTRGLYLPEFIGSSTAEAEFLLPPGSRMKVTKVQVIPTEVKGQYSSPLIKVTMELVGQEGIVEKEYDPDQPREPAGTPIGGRFAAGQRGNVILGEKVTGAMGSNAGGVYRGTDGVERYVKLYDDPAQAQGEHLANQLYRGLGFTAPESEVFTTRSGKVAYAGVMIKDARTLGSVGMTPDLADRILDGLAADVITANWDVIGMSDDNVLVRSDGAVVRVDNGGTFLMRAQAGRKPMGALQSISEYERFASSNRSYERVFQMADTTPELMRPRVAEQMKRIRKLRDDAGGWEKWVDRHAPGMSPRDRKAVIDMLDFRTNAMSGMLEDEVTKAVDARGNLHAEAGSSIGGQFMPKEGRFSARGTGLSHGEKGWTRPDGTPAADGELAKLKQYGVSKGYTDVRFNEKEDAPMQVRVTSVKTGREKRLYSREHMEQAAAKKYDRVKEFTARMADITATVERAVSNPDDDHHEEALVTRLLQVTGLRVGGEANEHLGISTLEAGNVRVSGNNIELDFIGKGGVRNHQVFSDSKVAPILKARVEKGGKIFDTNRSKVLDFVKKTAGTKFKAKDFRTFNGTARALEVIASMPKPKNMSEFKKARLAVAKAVSSFLGNTPTIALQSYIDPIVWGRIQPT